jgi:hypothetical protein
MPVTSYSRTPASNNSAPPNGAPEGQSPGSVNNVIRQLMTDTVNEASKNTAKVLSSVAGTNTITGAMSPALDAYTAGMVVIFTPANTNSGATTINIDTLGALDVLKGTGQALAAGDLVAGVPVILVLDSGADDFYLVGPSGSNSLYALLAAANTFAANQTIQVAGDTHLTLRDSTAAVDEKGYRIRSVAGQFAISLLDDSGGVVANLLVANRTTSTIDTLVFSATSMSLGADAILTAASSLDAANLTGTVPDASISSASVTQHQGDITSVNASATINSQVIGYRGVPRSTTATTLAVGDNGKCVAVSTHIAVPNSTFAAGNCVSVYNNSASAINITKAAGTQYKAGVDADDASISLAARGIATIWFNSATEWVVSGNVT